MASTTGEQPQQTPLDHESDNQSATLRQLVWRRFRRHKMAMAGAVMLILLVLYCIRWRVLFYRRVCQLYRDQAQAAASFRRASLWHRHCRP